MITNHSSTHLYVATWSMEIFIYDIRTFQRVSHVERLNLEPDGRYHKVQLTNDDSTLIVSDYQLNVHFYDVTNH